MNGLSHFDLNPLFFLKSDPLFPKKSLCQDQWSKCHFEIVFITFLKVKSRIKTTMKYHSDLTFITNEKDQNLLERFKVLIKDTEFFDVLVGYFWTSGFYTIYKSLENTQKIRILIGISTNQETADLIQQSKEEQYRLQFSHSETKKYFSNMLVNEMENSKDIKPVEEGIIKFLEWLKSGKLEIKAYPSQNIHAKLYIMSFAKEDRDKGRVITGSSNFTKSGFVDNLEFNVELKNPSDYEFAQNKFNELWQDAVDIKDQYIETIQKKTWLNNDIKPYELYLKFLYEYFKDGLNQTDKVSSLYVPEEFKKLEYQEQAVLNAKKILNEYGGVFVSDVVGLGKTYMSAMLAGQLDGRSLVLAPPILLDKKNPGSWPNVFLDFRIPADFESLGKLDQVSRRTEKYKNIFIDEAHRFRTETNITYEKLAQICRGKRVILVTATPLNNSPKDILSQIKLFQPAKNSTIPNVKNLELFFKNLEKKTKELDKKENHEQYMQVSKQNAKQIRDSVLKYLMVRRTRTEIEKYFKKDLKNQNVKFPEVQDPEPLLYQFNKTENKVFNKTVDIINQKISYARYTALTYYSKQEELEHAADIHSQNNLGRFMKILLVKRLESSFYAFKNTIKRFVSSYENFLKEFNAGHVYISKDYIHKIFNYLDYNNEEAIQKLLDEDKAKKYHAKDFKKSFKKNLENDLSALKEIQQMWKSINSDPKLDEFIKQVFLENSSHPVLQKNKLIVFTESKETANYLGKELKQKNQAKVLVVTGESSESVRDIIIENFDANARHQKDDYRILITTEVLSEGVNLHRSNVVINYDIPWNPTRLIQRVGRINRVDTGFDKIYTFNFFPTEQSNDIIKLKETAKTKIQTFISLLGADARLLTNREVIESHELFGRLISKKTIIGEEEEEESELKYLKIIKDIRDKNPDLFDRIKRLPKKARTAKKHPNHYKDQENQLLTYFRKGELQKFFLTGNETTKELDFMSSARLLEAKSNTAKEKLPDDFYNKLEQNKQSFLSATDEENQELETQNRGRDSSFSVLKYLKAIKKDSRQLTEDQEDYLNKVMKRITEGALPKQTTKTVLKALEKEIKTAKQFNSLKVLAILQNNISEDLLKEHIAENSANTKGSREVILSEYLIKE